MLEDAKTEILKSKIIDDSNKLDTASDIESIESQLKKESPDFGLIQKFWANADKVLTSAGLIKMATEIGNAIAGYI